MMRSSLFVVLLTLTAVLAVPAHYTDADCDASSVTLAARFPLPATQFTLKRDGVCVLGGFCNDIVLAAATGKRPVLTDPHIVDIITSALSTCRHRARHCTSVDIGANFGVMTLAMLQMGRTVVAVEPQPDLCAVLRHTVACNAHTAKIKVWCGAVAAAGDEGAIKTLQATSLHRYGHVVDVGHVTVPLYKLTEVIPSGSYDFIKIDTDAIDRDILKQLIAMVQAGTHNVTSLTFESWTFPSSAGALLHQLQGMGFSIYRTLLWERRFDQDGSLPTPLAIGDMPPYAVERFNLRYNRYLWLIKPLSADEWVQLAASKTWQYFATRERLLSSELVIEERTR